MKHIKKILIITMFIMISLLNVNISPISNKQEVIGVIMKYPTKKNDLKQYLYDLGNRESKNNYTIVNTLGYMGRFQFGMSTLKSIGIDVTEEQFLQDALLQDMAMLRLLKTNRKTLSNIIHKYDSTYVNGLLVTESGILAGAHLGGSGNVKKYLNRNGKYNKKDAYGTSVGSYTHTFSGYELNLD